MQTLVRESIGLTHRGGADCEQRREGQRERAEQPPCSGPRRTVDRGVERFGRSYDDDSPSRSGYGSPRQMAASNFHGMARTHRIDDVGLIQLGPELRLRVRGSEDLAPGVEEQGTRAGDARRHLHEAVGERLDRLRGQSLTDDARPVLGLEAHGSLEQELTVAHLEDAGDRVAAGQSGGRMRAPLHETLLAEHRPRAGTEEASASVEDDDGETDRCPGSPRSRQASPDREPRTPWPRDQRDRCRRSLS